MNTHDIDIELPPLPSPIGIVDPESTTQTIYGMVDMAKYATAYAHAAIEPYAKRIAQLEAARFAYASEFPPNEEGDPDVGSIHENIRNLKVELEADRRRGGEQIYTYHAHLSHPGFGWIDPIMDADCPLIEMGIAEDICVRLNQRVRATQPADPVAWLYEDELPDNYPYDTMFPYSKVDGVRMFPVYAPQPAKHSRGDPVYLFRRLGQPSGDFVTCSLERYAELSELPEKFDTMVTYTAPQPAEPVKVSDEADALTVAYLSGYHKGKELVKLECPKCGADRAKEPCAGNLMNCAFKGEAHAAEPVKVPQPHEFNTGNEKLDALLDDTFYLAKDGGTDNGIKWYESLQDFLQSIEPVKLPSDSAIMFEWSQTPNTGDMRVDLIVFARALLARYTTTKE